MMTVQLCYFCNLYLYRLVETFQAFEVDAINNRFTKKQLEIGVM